ncbi:MAG: oligosaccharide flippase family protein [Desulfuromonadales bacterium]
MSLDVRNLIYGACPRALRPFWKRVESSDVGSRLARGAFWSLAGAMISRGLMLIASILVARILGQAGYGEFAMVRSTVNMFVIFAGFGLGMTATKHVAELYKPDPERAGRIMALSGLFAFVSGACVSLAVFAFAPWLAAKTINAPHLTPVLRIGAFILFINALNGAQTGALAGFEAFKTIAKVNFGVGLASFPLMVGGAYWGGIYGAIWALLLNMAINWLLNHLALRKVSAQNGVPFSLHNCTSEWSILWQYSLPAALGGFIVSPALWVCNAFLVNQPGGYAQMGIFEAANQWRIAILFIPSMVGQVVFPLMSNLLGADQNDKYLKVLKYNVLLNGVCSLIVAVFVSVLGPWILRSYGKGFEDGYWVLVLLVSSAVLIAINQVVGQAIASRGKMWIGLSFNILWALALIGFSAFFLFRGYGALGLSIAYFMSYLLHSLWQGIYAWNTIKSRDSRKIASDIL